MNRKLFLTLLIICLLSLPLVACGPEKPDDNPDVSTGSDVVDVPDEPAEQEQLTPIVNCSGPLLRPRQGRTLTSRRPC